jgi:putative DNA primase/helicase
MPKRRMPTSASESIFLSRPKDKLGQAAELDPISYDRARQQLAKDLGVRLETLDDAVRERREDAEVEKLVEEETPWPDPVDGGDLLEELCVTFQRFNAMQASEALACALWVLFAHAHDAFWYSPLLYIHSRKHRCGKTSLIKTLIGVTPMALPLSNVTPAAIFRAVDRFHPTLLMDEGDAYSRRTLEEYRGIMNSGHDREMAKIIRSDGGELRTFSSWCPKALARIGEEHVTMMDRSIPIELKRKPKDVKTEKHPPRVRQALQELRQKCVRWAQDNFKALEAAKPTLPDELDDRAKDNWGPLLAVADVCGRQVARSSPQRGTRGERR